MARPYHNLHQHIATLRERDLLIEADKPRLYNPIMDQCRILL
jgi:hypothetical protein